ncbi:MAG TPA: hypothetical protein VNS60_14340 [Solirubrobacterales bacterium]|nr:hypothetical protein [Solirubrobacterales bacterium]
MNTASEHGQHLVGFRSARPAEPEPEVVTEAGTMDKRRIFRLPLLRGRAATDATSREERAAMREREKELRSVEATKNAFFETPAGRARLAYKRGHRLFQYELEINELSPTLIPGPAGSPARVTTDPVDILNAVTVEGWKLVTGKFIHSEMRHGVVGCYLFKRSQKRHLAMNNPWQAPSITD